MFPGSLEKFHKPHWFAPRHRGTSLRVCCRTLKAEAFLSQVAFLGGGPFDMGQSLGENWLEKIGRDLKARGIRSLTYMYRIL